MSSNDVRLDAPAPAALLIADRVSAFLSAVYGWTGAGLAITATTAWLIARSPTLVSAIATNRVVFWGLMIAQLGIVFVLSARVQRLAASTASLLFVLYSALTGVTIPFVLLAYTGESVATTFFITAGMFGALAAYGTVTRRSLAGLGHFLFMGLIGVILASVVGMFCAAMPCSSSCRSLASSSSPAWPRTHAERLKAMALATPEGQSGVVCDCRRTGVLSRFRQSLFLPAAVLRQPTPMTSRWHGRT